MATHHVSVAQSAVCAGERGIAALRPCGAGSEDDGEMEKAMTSLELAREIVKSWSHELYRVCDRDGGEELAQRIAQALDAARAEPREEDAKAMKDAKEALDSIWAAIGDALCSGKGIEKAYANSVANECRAASDALARAQKPAR